MRKLLLTNLLAVAIITGSYSDQQEDSADEKRCARYGMSCDDISLDVITISSWLSADGLALMTSSVTSSYSADGLSEQSQESAGSLHPDARRSDVVEEIQSQATVHQEMLFGDKR
ncbi:CAX-interacting protein 4-like [Dorcoceras hygrometricum]|uniref:CAX-interacting protein 4-like n=1 Tax=Dorcoceras hygrometricum TaxID=472368 RepID=A0A2Z7B939_9LAMI|nr:CAX-interacting protein 4-like [Dorcoceras hygrometricum]